MNHLPPLSLLDLVPVRAGGTVREALAISTRTAQLVEQLGFQRYWVAEHHNMAGIASSATAILIGHLAAATRTIRVGSGGIMLPNHTPLVVAEAFGTLAELHPGRIDLGLGRAPGTDALTMRALRRDRVETEDQFPRDVAMLQALFEPAEPGQRLVATPGAGTRVPIWLLGSSLFSARLAAERGLPFAFASHFAPRLLQEALALYRNQFVPSADLAAPHSMICVPVIAGATDEEAEFLASSLRQRVRGLLTGDRHPLQPPVEHFLSSLTLRERQAIGDFLAAAAIGSPATVHAALETLCRSTQADECMLVCDIFDEQERRLSLERVAALAGLARAAA